MLKCRNVFLLFFLLGIHNISVANQNHSGFQYSLFSGITQVHIQPGFLLIQGEDDLLIANRRRETKFTWGLGIAYYLLTTKSSLLHDISIGLNLFQFRANQYGSIWQYQLPVYNNFNYKLPVNSIRLMAGSEITFTPLYKQLLPFFEMAMGVARNKISYSDKPIPGFGGAETFIRGATHFDTAFSLGAGFKLLLCKNMAMSLRYRYSNLGYGQTSQVSNIPITSPLMVKLTTQDWLVGLTYTV